jgi:1-acyl-sn-glycerol-3-phosphate acyltransferase
VPWFYYVCRLIVKTLFLLLTRWQIKGRENIPSQGPVLIVANHLHLADPPLLVVSLGRRVMFMAKKELFHFRVIGYFIRGLGAFPVNRGQLDRKALRQVHQILADGQALVLFPEGTRSKTAQLQTAFPGVALIASRSGVPIIPVGITGTEKIKGMVWVLHRPRITVNIGRPFYPPPVNGKLTKAELAKLTNSIMGHIAELLPPQYQGNYAGQGN